MNKSLEQRLAELEQRVAELEEDKMSLPAAAQNGFDREEFEAVMEDRKALKRDVRGLMQLMEDKMIEVAIYDDEDSNGELYFERWGEKSGQLIKVKYADMARAFMS